MPTRRARYLLAGMKRTLLRGLYSPELLESRIAPATFLVTTLADAGSGSLRAAIDGIAGVGGANDSPGADTITFAPALTGIITLTTGQIPIGDTLTIKGPGVDKLTISGGDVSRIFFIDDADPAVLHPTTISGLTLLDGKAVGGGQSGGAISSTESLSLKNVVIASSYAADDGGAVQVNTTGKVSITGSRIVDNYAKFAGGGLYIKSSSLTIVKSTVSFNSSQFAAGGLYARAVGSKATVTIDSSIFNGNASIASRAGGLLLTGEDDSKFLIKNSLISGNTASAVGGGMYFNSGHVTIAKTTFAGNTADEGGAICDDGAESLTITGSRFVANRATAAAGDGGGALYLQGAKAVKITGTLFSANSSANDGGAIAGYGLATALNISGSTFFGNTAVDAGGAIFLDDSASLVLKGSVLSGNIASGTGGGAIYGYNGTSLTVSGSRFLENQAPGSQGGAIFVDANVALPGDVTLSGNLFQGNLAQSTGGAVAITGSVTFSSKGDKVLGNFVQNGTGGGFHIASEDAITLTGTLLQGNLASDRGGGLFLDGTATLTGLKVLDNVAGFGSGGGGIYVDGGSLVGIFKSLITGNLAGTGGGIFDDGTTTLDAATLAKTKGNAARVDPNTHGI